MSRGRAKVGLSAAARDQRALEGVQQLLAAALVLVALALFGVQGFAAAPRVVQRSVASLHTGSEPRLVDAAPHRLDAPLKRDRVWLDLPLGPAAYGSRLARLPSAQHATPALGPGRARPRDLRLSHFRRRIPRMNSEDPPCA
jgi:hypothetical protein